MVSQGMWIACYLFILEGQLNVLPLRGGVEVG